MCAHINFYFSCDWAHWSLLVLKLQLGKSCIFHQTGQLHNHTLLPIHLTFSLSYTLAHRLCYHTNEGGWQKVSDQISSPPKWVVAWVPKHVCKFLENFIWHFCDFHVAKIRLSQMYRWRRKAMTTVPVQGDPCSYVKGYLSM